jgi:hypothetical protein
MDRPITAEQAEQAIHARKIIEQAFSLPAYSQVISILR